MVNFCHLTSSMPLLWGWAPCWLWAAEEPKLPINRLDPLTRTKVVMALLGLVILALGAIVCIRLGGHWVKRIVRSQPEEPKSHTRKSLADLPTDWDRKE